MYHSIVLGKGVLSLLKILNLGSGSTWPGHISLKADRDIIKRVIRKNPDIKIVLIAGTNGKTTTTKALSHILAANGISTLTNQSGANLLNGLASLIVKHVRLSGKLKHKAIIFEADENSLPLLLEEIPNPDGIILLNLFRDQLDRYGEINITAEKWKESLEKLGSKTLIIANADDPLIVYIAKSAEKTVFFTIDDFLKREEELTHAVDSITCPNCKNFLIYSKIAYSHLGNYKCIGCAFKRPRGKKFEINTDLQGVYNVYNLTSSVLAADKVFKINPYKGIKTLKNFKPAFGRQESFNVNGKKVILLLSKNPTGFNESIKVALKLNPQSILLLLNDRIPDGRDISWIWDVDFENLNKLSARIYVSGDRAYDLANRLLFGGVTHEVIENFDKSYKEALNSTAADKTLLILPTYSAMLETRKIISGKAIL